MKTLGEGIGQALLGLFVFAVVGMVSVIAVAIYVAMILLL